jgi:hypothetical protein
MLSMRSLIGCFDQEDEIEAIRVMGLGTKT